MPNPVSAARPELLLGRGTHHGYQWEVMANGIGYRCGYVRIPEGHPWHSTGYDDIEAADGGFVDVHGGLTYAAPDTEDGSWWLGFDCAHAGDAPDPLLPGYERLYRGFDDLDFGTVKTTEFVIVECHGLAEQAEEITFRPPSVELRIVPQD